MRTAEEDIRDISVELIKMREGGYEPAELAEAIASALSEGQDKPEAGFSKRFEQWLDEQEADKEPEGFDGAWTIRQTPTRNPFNMTAMDDPNAASWPPCTIENTETVTSSWTVTTTGASARVQAGCAPGQRETSFPAMNGTIKGDTLLLMADGPVDGDIRVEMVLLPDGSLSGHRGVFVNGCVTHWLVEGSR